MKKNFLPNRITTSPITAAACINVVLQIRKTFDLQSVVVTGSVRVAADDMRHFQSRGQQRHRIRNIRVHVAEHDLDVVSLYRFAGPVPTWSTGSPIKSST
jgi:hypothetical protein